jgi:hypothetical protein
MTYNLKNLNVASLDFDNIVTSLISFLEVQPGLTDIAFRDKSTMANRLINILATATAYNGIYAQFGFTETALSTATLLESVISIASNYSVLIPITQSAKATCITRQTLTDYQSFYATGTDGANINFYVLNGVLGGTSANEVELYSGSSVSTYTNYDYTSQSMLLPLTVDPRTISFYVAPDARSTSTAVKWTRVDKGNQTENTNNNYFTVIHSANGYLVTNNFSNTNKVSTANSVYVKAIIANGVSGNSSSILDPGSIFDIVGTPIGGYGAISVDTAKAKLLFDLGYGRCVSIKDFENAILASLIPGTENMDNIYVNNGDIPGVVKVYVDGLSVGYQSQLISYLQPKLISGIQLVYSQ